MRENGFFQSARPIWPEGMEKEMNLCVGFRTVFHSMNVSELYLVITASMVYRFYVNGIFAGYGPARGPHGYLRVDRWDLGNKAGKGYNILAIEAVGYNINSYQYAEQTSCLQAEVIAGGHVLAATGVNGFEAYLLTEKVQRIQRYSFQRCFMEAYRLNTRYKDWKESGVFVDSPVVCSPQEQFKLLDRGVSYPDFALRYPVRQVADGRIEHLDSAQLWENRSLKKIGPQIKGFPEDQLEVHISDEVCRLQSHLRTGISRISRDGVLLIDKDTCRIMDFGLNLTGFPGAEISCSSWSRILIMFDERLDDGDVHFIRSATAANAIVWELQPGTHSLESIEPYTFRYLKLVCWEGNCEVRNIHLREYANPEGYKAQFVCSDYKLNAVFEAGHESFRQNAVDIFMDCPGRERAGWLCDSYFTGQAAVELTGHTSVERNFLENYLLLEDLKELPEGMLPMCYPADFKDGAFIPQWSMWLVLELEGYLQRSADYELVNAFEPKAYKLLNYFKKYRNTEGLLENLPGWNFIDDSESNRLTSGINYPTNMLYAAMLDALSHLYGDAECAGEAQHVREMVRRQSGQRPFFADHAVNKEGKWLVAPDSTEAAQYYAFHFGLATPESHSELWDQIVHLLGPTRDPQNILPQVYPADVFIGCYLRLNILARYGKAEAVVKDLREFFYNQAAATGTLWEHAHDKYSMNHGFTSQICCVLNQVVLGIKKINRMEKRIDLRFLQVPVEWCRGKVPMEEDELEIDWWKADNRLHYSVRMPDGYTIRIENLSGMELVCHL